MIIEAERAQRFLDSQSTHPALLPLDSPIRLLHDLMQAKDRGDFYADDEDDCGMVCDDVDCECPCHLAGVM